MAGNQAWPVASAMAVACGGRATSDTSREGAGQTLLTASLLRSEASAVVSAVLESSVMLLVLVMLLVVACVWVLVLVSPGVQRRRYYHQRHHPEAAVLVQVPQLPVQRGPRGLDQ